MDLEMLLEQAVSKAQSLEPGTKFVVRELFEGVEWNLVTRRNKLDLGRVFKRYANAHSDCGFAYVGKRPNNSAEYLRNNED